MLQAKSRFRLRTGAHAAFIKRQCKQIATKFRKHGRTSTLTETPGQRKCQWAFSVVVGNLNTALPLPSASLVEENEEYTERYDGMCVRIVIHRTEKIGENLKPINWEAAKKEGAWGSAQLSNVAGGRTRTGNCAYARYPRCLLSIYRIK